jgi:AcrR family transcriptional regulator
MFLLGGGMSRKKDLLDAAMTHFSQKGYHRTTGADIVKTANVAQGTFYLYFDTKKAIMVSLIEEFFALIKEAVTLDLSSEGVLTVEDVAVQVKNAIRRILVVYWDNAILARIFLREAVGLEPDFIKLRETVMEYLARYGAAVLDVLIEQNLLPPQNTHVSAHCVVGMIEHVADQWLNHDVDLELEDLVNALARFELLGVCGVPSKQMEKILSDRAAAAD